MCTDRFAQLPPIETLLGTRPLPRAVQERVVDQFRPLAVRLAVFTAKTPAGRAFGPLDDWISEALLAVLDAAGRFDPARGVKLITWLYQDVPLRLRARAHGANGLIRLPAHAYGQRSRLSPAAAAAAHRARRLCPVPVGTHVGSERTLEPLTPAPDPLAPDADDLALLERGLDALPPRLRTVLQRRYGLAGHAAGTLREVGAALGITKERVRQLEADGLRRLRQTFGVPAAGDT